MSDALLEAIRMRNTERVAALLAAGADPNAHFNSCYGIAQDITALQVAIAELVPRSQREPRGPVDAVILLLRHGADVNGWDEQKDATPLLCAVMNQSIEAARILLAAGADPNVSNAEGFSPLRYCAQEGDLEMARLLLLCGATETIDEWGGPGALTALSFAARGLHVEMVKLLLEYGADPQGQNVDRMIPLDYLEFVVAPEDPANQERMREIRRLLGAPEPADPTAIRIGKEK